MVSTKISTGNNTLMAVNQKCSLWNLKWVRDAITIAFQHSAGVLASVIGAKPIKMYKEWWEKSKLSLLQMMHCTYRKSKVIYKEMIRVNKWF